MYLSTTGVGAKSRLGFRDLVPALKVHLTSNLWKYIFPDIDLFKSSYLGNSREWGTPVPIPNTEVKPLLADGTATLVVEE